MCILLTFCNRNKTIVQILRFLHHFWMQSNQGHITNQPHQHTNNFQHPTQIFRTTFKAQSVPQAPSSQTIEIRPYYKTICKHVVKYFFSPSQPNGKCGLCSNRTITKCAPENQTQNTSKQNTEPFGPGSRARGLRIQMEPSPGIPWNHRQV